MSHAVSKPSQRMVLLLAEDQEDDVVLFKRAVQKAEVNIEIHHVSDGEDAIAFLKGEKGYERKTYPFPDLVLVDLKMPRRTGFEVIEWVRNSDFSRLRIVVLTSSKDQNDINRAYESGANSYLAKPHNLDQLTSLIKNLYVYWAQFSQCPDLTVKSTLPKL